MKTWTFGIAIMALIVVSCSRLEPCFDYIISGSYDEVANALNNGLDPNTQDECGNCLVKVAAGYQDVRITKMLIDYGCDVNLCNEDGRNSLMTASLCAHLDTVRLLLESGANVNKQDNYGQTALMHATRPKRSVEVMELLLYHGAEINTQDAAGNNALDWAIMENNLDAVRYLVERGIDIHAKNDCGLGPLELAKDYNNDDRREIVAYLEGVLASGTTPPSLIRSRSE